MSVPAECEAPNVPGNSPVGPGSSPVGKETESPNPKTPRGGALQLEATKCCNCQVDDAEPVGVGEDFEYRTSPDTFLAVRCRRCGLVYLNPRPAESELCRIYPDHYHAFSFDEQKFGLIHQVRQRLEARRLMSFARGLGEPLRVLDVGCGDGFHLQLLRNHAPRTWTLEGIDTDARAVRAAQAKGLNVRHGQIETAALPENHYDLVLMIMTIEHLYDPLATLREVARVTAPGGRLLIVTDNVDSPDFSLFKSRHWGGYHFPRHTYLFNSSTLQRVLMTAGFETERVRSAMSPVNWVYSIRNWFDDWGAPRWLVNFFSLHSPLALAAGTLFDIGWNLFGRGAILHGSFRKPK